MVTKDQIIEALKTVLDPEILLDVWFLGLIYNIDIDGSSVKIEMTFTTPMCPAGPQLIGDVRSSIEKLPGVSAVDVKVVFTPPWEPSDEVKAMLGMI